jgi:GNAT superfamily N-acetyltransferase
VDLSAATATDVDAGAIAEVRTRAADQLTREHGRGAWSWGTTDKGVLRDIKTSQVLVAVSDARVLGTLRLTTSKPWAIESAYFTDVKRPLYLVDMAVDPGFQRRGVGRFLLEQATLTARDWPADAIRLDAFDAPAGAGPFYIRCGFTEVGRAIYRGVPHVYFELLLE